VLWPLFQFARMIRYETVAGRDGGLPPHGPDRQSGGQRATGLPL